MASRQALRETAVMPYGPDAGKRLDDCDVETLVAMAGEPLVPVVDKDGLPVAVEEQHLSPYGGAMGKIRRCKCWPAVSEIIREKAPKLAEGLDLYQETSEPPQQSVDDKTPARGKK